MIIRFKPLLKVTLSIAIAFTFALSGAFAYNIGDPFIDNDEITNVDYFGVHIKKLSDNNFITGEIGKNKVPTGKFHPTDNINRAEFSKIIAISRFAEDIGEKNEWEDMTYGKMESELDDIFHPYYKCTSSECFSDVKGKEPECDKEKGCDPWFTQYVNYLAGKGIVSGKEDGKFYPGENIIRIHAFKMLMTDNGKASLSQNKRYQNLIELTESRNSTKPKCLAGTESEILIGNNTKLLSYALLADRLDFFGHDCELINNEYGILIPTQDIINYLNAPMTREEVTRFLALSSFYEPIAVNPYNDDTVNTASQNVGTDADGDYQMPDEGADKSKYDDNGNPSARQVVQSKKSEEVNDTTGQSENIQTEDSENYNDLLISVGHDIPCKETTIKAGEKFEVFSGVSKYTYNGKIKFQQFVAYGNWYCNVSCDYLNTSECMEVVESERGGEEEEIVQKSLKDKLYKIYDDYVNEKGYSIAETCALALKSSAYKTERFEIAKSWCIDNGVTLEEKEPDLTREEQIINEMDKHHYTDGFNELDTCVWAIERKVVNGEEYNIVLGWCNNHGITEKKIEDKADILIKAELDNYYVNNNRDPRKAFRWGVDKLSENCIRYKVVSEWVNTTINDIYNADGNGLFDSDSSLFNIKKRGKTDSLVAYNEDLYILVHGWRSDSSAWADKMSKSIMDNNPSAQILLIDWSSIAKSIYNGGLSPHMASTWIGSIASETKTALGEWGAQNTRTTIIGHSLGALLAEELSKKIGGANVTALDPAASIFGYTIDTNDSVFKSFSGNNSTCLVADASLSGSQTLMATCREGYLIDYSGNPDFPLFTELYEYVDFVIDEAIADTVEYVVDKGITYAVEKTISRNIGGRIRGVRIYKIMDGKLKEVFIENVEEKACKVVNGAVKYLPYICEYGIKEVKDRFVKYHNDVHKVYNTIIDNPFKNNLLSPKNIASRKGGATPFAIVGKKAHGIIYTERDNPNSIKYLKVLKSKNSSRYTLYGNIQDNDFECNTDKDCDMYGDRGNDKFLVKKESDSFEIKDFIDNEGDGDELIVKEYEDMTAMQYSNGSLLLIDQKGGDSVTVTLNTPYGTAKGWVEIVNGTYIKKDGTKPTPEELRSLRENNPIQIQ